MPKKKKTPKKKDHTPNASAREEEAECEGNAGAPKKKAKKAKKKSNNLANKEKTVNNKMANRKKSLVNEPPETSTRGAQRVRSQFDGSSARSRRVEHAVAVMFVHDRMVAAERARNASPADPIRGPTEEAKKEDETQKMKKASNSHGQKGEEEDS